MYLTGVIGEPLHLQLLRHHDHAWLREGPENPVPHGRRHTVVLRRIREVVEEMIQEVPRSSFQGVEDIQPGMSFQAETNQGPVSVVVTAVTEETVTVDGNHPLAGKTLNFEVTVESVREATKDELEHGHIHGPGCSH